MATHQSDIRFVGPDEVEKCLGDYDALTCAIEASLANYSKEKGKSLKQPVRCIVSAENGFLGCMPVYSKNDNVLTTKIVTFFPKNEGVPTHHALILVCDPTNGVPKAVLDGDVITARRTAAASAVASKHLADTQPKVLAILGTGVQAKSHLDCFSSLYQFEKIRIWSRRPEGASQFIATLPKDQSQICLPCTDVKTAVQDASIIVTVTSSTEPILRAEWVKKGAHINSVGACRPDWAEIEGDLMRSSVVYVDSYEGAAKESGDIILANADVFAEIGEVINGTKPAKKSETTIFKSFGMAIEDGVAAKLVLTELGM